MSTVGVQFADNGWRGVEMGGERNTWKTIALVFVLCAFADFVHGYIRGGSIVGGVISLSFGFFGTAIFVFLLYRPNTEDGSRDSSDR